MTTDERKQKLAELKASIELLEQCKQKIYDNPKLDDKAKKDRTSQIDEAIKENYDKGRAQLQATKKEIDEAQYGEVSEEYKEKYKRRLEAKGLTDEQLRQKEQASVVVTAGNEPTERKRHRRTKRTEQRDDENGFDPSDIKRLDNEEELMRKTLVKDKKDLERRRHRTTDTMSDKPKTKTVQEVIGTVIEEKKVNDRVDAGVSVTLEGNDRDSLRENKRVMENTEKEPCDYDFDTSVIPSNVQYDILPLPSNGECYPHKKNRIPVAYLTAADENIIASPNMYRDGKIIDTILERKILDKDIKVGELCKGDRDAIILWLRATGYGTDFPVVARHPKTGKEYPINVKLDTLKYYPFNLKGDEDGYFEYIAKNGDVIKFKYLSTDEEDKAKEELIAKTTELERYQSVRHLNNLQESIDSMELPEGDKKELADCIADMRDIINFDNVQFDIDSAYSFSITNQMVMYTMSVNGNTDRDFIRTYINNMRSKDAYDYRSFVNDNTPGVNMKITINVPSSDGGGTFTTFLGFDEYVFVNL